MNKSDIIKPIGRLAVLILESEDGDHLDDLRTLQPILPPVIWDEVCYACDVCPEHVWDVEICLDDALDCKGTREFRGQPQ